MLRRALPAVALPLLLAAVVASLVMMLGGLASGQTTPPTPRPPLTPTLTPILGPPSVFPSPDPADPGYRLFLRDCAWCHGNQADGTTRGPSLTGAGAASADFQLGTGRMPLTRVEQEPDRKAPRYTTAQIRRLVRFISSLGPGPQIPHVDPASGSLERGQILYQGNCAACHSSTGAGGALTSGQRAPALDLATPTQIGEAIRLGPGTMPAFGPTTLAGDDVNSLARYIDYLQAPDDQGGNPLGHIGPVTEGLVGLVVGLGALLLVSRWIGTRS
jgi:quinol---cytochrome-c reductase cytochrome c subunit